MNKALFIIFAFITLVYLGCELPLEISIPHENSLDPDNPDYSGPDLPEVNFENLPSILTNLTSLSVVVSGNGIVSYKFKLDDQEYTEEIAIETPISLSNLAAGEHKIYVIGKNGAGVWQWESRALMFSWTIDASFVTVVVSSTPGFHTLSKTLDIVVNGLNITSYRYRLDEGSWSPEQDISNHITATDLQAGTYILGVIGKNNTGIWQSEEYMTTYTWTVYNEPAAALTSLPNTDTLDDSINIGVGGADILSYKYSLDDGEYGVEIPVSQPLTETELASGVHNIKVLGKIAHDLWQTELNATAYSWTVYPVPVVEISDAPTGIFVIDDFTITVTGVDITAYKFNLDDSSYGDETVISEQIILTDLAEGVHSLSVIGKNSAGLWQTEASAAVAVWTIGDIIAPVAELSNLPEDPLSDSAAVVSVAGPGVVAYKYRMDGGAWSTEYALVIDINLSFAEGDHSLEVCGKNSANDWQADSEATTYEWFSDHSPPDIESISPNFAGLNEEITLTAVVTEPHSALTVSWDTDGNDVYDDSATITFTDTTGIHTIKCKAVSIGGETILPHEINVVDDVIAELGGLPADPFNGSEATVTVGGSWVVAYKYRLDAGAWSAEIDINTDISLSFTEGDHTLEVIGKNGIDEWQLEGGATTYSWFSDHSPPVIESISPPSARINGEITLTAVVTDPHSAFTVSWDTDDDSVYGDSATVTFSDTGGIHIVNCRAVSTGGETILSHNVDVLDAPLYAGSITIDATDTAGDIALLSSYSGLTGDLSIESTSLTSLSGLENIFEIQGGLDIEDNINLTSLTALSQLSSLGGGLTLSGNTLLSDITALSGITSIQGGDLYINNCDALASLDGLHNVSSISGTLMILDMNNAGFTDLSGLENLSSIGGDLQLGPTSDIGGNNTLLSLAGLEKLSSIGGSLKIHTNNSLASLNGLQNLTSISGNLEIGANNNYGPINLSDISQLSGITSVPGFLNICATTLLTDLSGISNIESVGSLIYIINNDGLQTINLPNLTSVGGNISVSTNSVLTSLSMNNITSAPSSLQILNNIILSSINFSSLESIGNHFTISDSSALQYITGFDKLDTVIGDLGINSNSALVDIDGFNGTAQLQLVGGQIFVDNNSLLEDLDGFAGLVSLGGDLTISDNPVLSSIGGLSGLTGSLPASLYLDNNDSLLNFQGLEGITAVTDNLRIRYHQDLVTLAALDDIISIGGSLFIGENASLTSVNLTSLATIGNDLLITDNPSLTSFALTDLTSIGLMFQLNSCPSISGFAGLENLQSIGRGFIVNNNSALMNFDSLDSLNSISSVGATYFDSINCGLYIGNNDSLTDLDGLSDTNTNDNAAITFVNCLVIKNNEYLIDIGGLSNVASVPFGIRIINNDSLISLAGLIAPSLTSYSSYILIGGNASLTDLDGLSNITSISAGNILEIDNNGSLTDLSDLAALGAAYTIRIHDNDALTAFGMMSTGSGTISGDLRVQGNDPITDSTISTYISNNNITVTGSTFIEDNGIGVTYDDDY
ncbi:MAG: hypothetical protein JEY99_21355 [Spirochaetales bacterium]|nr:hypothetical protein [Spirochaetales bacterium]